MKKITKQAIIWSSVALGLGGAAAGIAIPIINNHKERANIDPIGLTGNETFYQGSPTVKNMMDADKSSIEVRNSRLLGNTEHQLSFYLYDEEQKASLKLQKAFFEWHKHEIVKNLDNFYKNTLHEVSTLIDGTIEAQYNDLVTKVQTKITAITNADDKKSRQRTFDDIKKDWNNNTEKIDHITKNTVDYGASRFNEKYPKVLLPLTNIQSKQAKIFKDQRDAHVKSAATTDEGERTWFAGLSKRYHGATSEDEAIEGMVFNEIKNKAFSRFQYSIESSFTYEQFTSGVFRDYLGDPTVTKAGTTATPAEITKRDTDSLNNNGVAIKASHEDTDKVFFLGSKSNVKEWFNPVMGNKVDGFKGLHHLTRTHNAILGFKQDKTDPNAPWEADKKMLTNLFKVFVSGSTVTQVSDAWKSIYTTGKEDLTKRLVQNYSLTTDSTQSRSGDLGISTTLDSFAPMAPGFALGVLSILNSHVPGVTPATMHSDADFLTHLMDKLKKAFEDFATAKGITLAKPADATDLAKVKRYNQQVEDIINNKMTADDLKVTFGTVIRDVYQELEAHYPGADANKEGVPLAIKISENVDAVTKKITGVYAVLSEKYGLHIIQYEQNNPATFKSELNADLAKAVEKQDTRDIATNYAGLLLKNLTSLGKLAKLLDVQEDSPGVFSIHNTDVMTFLTSKATELGYDDSNKANMNTDIATMIGRLRNSEHISEIQKAITDATSKWLKDKIDKHLIVDGDMTIKPEDLYNIVSAVDAETRTGVTP